MKNLKLTTALVATLIAAPAFAQVQNNAKTEIIAPTGSVTTEAELDGAAPVDGNAKNEAIAAETMPRATDAEVDSNARYSATTEGAEAGSTTSADVTVAAPTEPLDNENERNDAVTPDTKLSGTLGEQEDNARTDAVTNDEASGTVAESDLPGDNARYESVTADAKMQMTGDDSPLQGVRVYDANDNWIGEVSAVSSSSAIIDVGGFLGIGEKPVELDWAQLDVLQERDGDEIRVYTKLTEAELEAMPTYQY